MHITFVRYVPFPNTSRLTSPELPCVMPMLTLDDHSLLDRSTNLDSWTLAQLRTMKVGGNQSATDFFVRNGGQSLLSDSDTRKKYSSRYADAYKEELANRAQQDAIRLVLLSAHPKAHLTLFYKFPDPYLGGGSYFSGRHSRRGPGE